MQLYKSNVDFTIQSIFKTYQNHIQDIIRHFKDPQKPCHILIFVNFVQRVCNKHHSKLPNLKEDA